MWDDMIKGIITSAPPPEEYRPFALADLRAAMDRLADLPYTRDRYVFPHSRWGRILEAASPEFRAELESLRANGTIVVSSMLPDEDHAYHIKGQSWTP